MKIIVTDRKAEQFHFRPDNTLVKDSAPFYKPSFLRELAVSFGYAFRIEKPAKAVNIKYSDRYINKYSPGVLLYGVADKKMSINKYNTIETSFDKSSYIVDNMKEICDCNLTLSCDNNNYSPVEDFYNLPSIAGVALEKLSYLFSFKTGDIIFIECSKKNLITPPCDITLYSNQTPVLEFKAK